MTEGDKTFSVTVVYNGVRKSIEVNPKQALQAVFQHALKVFGLQGTANNLQLMLGNTQLNLNTKVEDAGIKPGSELFLRPRQARGG